MQLRVCGRSDISVSVRSRGKLISRSETQLVDRMSVSLATCLHSNATKRPIKRVCISDNPLDCFPAPEMIALQKKKKKYSEEEKLVKSGGGIHTCRIQERIHSYFVSLTSLSKQDVFHRKVCILNLGKRTVAKCERFESKEKSWKLISEARELPFPPRGVCNPSQRGCYSSPATSTDGKEVFSTRDTLPWQLGREDITLPPGVGEGFGYIIACEEFNFSSGVTNGGSRSPEAPTGCPTSKSVGLATTKKSRASLSAVSRG
ncbi:hypothetical protein CEXT_193711 [Caerostris extrusa]|uniref:Uncharacterized protein n=1 Tax=Caerostris extrusa TaxID=172846 RepID=A0AAV4WUW7_CAEEX|nr:hypothetical protein CEXT_193711 [Caerostris extrusa]